MDMNLNLDSYIRVLAQLSVPVRFLTRKQCVLIVNTSQVLKQNLRAQEVPSHKNATTTIITRLAVHTVRG